jgi:hypothetical protein
MEPEHLQLEYFLAKGLSLVEASTLLEAVCSCAIENPSCADKATVDSVIKQTLEKKGD